jgi:hypothetical protein
MNPTPSETADLLERAADLYESEQIQWCKGNWATPYSENRSGQFHCAEGVLLRAAGFSWAQVMNAQAKLSSENEDDPDIIAHMMRLPQIQQAIRAVNGHVVTIEEDEAWLWHLNDRLAPDTAKETLIQRFKEAAKELRNGS